MRKAGRTGAAMLLAPLLLCCAPSRAAEQLRGGILFYSWDYGATLSGDPASVERVTQERVRGLQEVEDFAGNLDAWRGRTAPVQRLEVAPTDLAVDGHIYFYYLAALRESPVAAEVQGRIYRRGPDGEESLDLVTVERVRSDRLVQAGGMLFPIRGLPGGEHRLRMELTEGEDVLARGELVVDYRPSPAAGFPGLSARAIRPMKEGA